MNDSVIQASVPAFDQHVFREKQHEYCVLIFVINEGQKLIKQLDRMSQFRLGVDIVIVDGGSTDGSTDHDFLQSKNVNTLLVKTDTGKLGSQMRIGFHWALQRDYKGVVVIDGNNKDSVHDIPAFVAKLEEGYDHVQGSRFIPGGNAINTPKSRLVGLKVLHVPVMRAASGFRYTDTTNGFRAYSKDFLEDPRVAIFRTIFTGYELHYYLAQQAPRLRFKCTEIPVTREYPKTGKVPTKISPIRGNLQVIGKLFNVAVGFYDPRKSSFQLPGLVPLGLSLLIVLIAFLSFQFNAFKVTKQTRFENFQIDSEQLVVDGLYRAEVHGGDVRLGVYNPLLVRSAPGGFDFQQHFVDYQNKNIQGEFEEYDSQYGLQLNAFHFLSRYVSRDLGFLRAVNSLMMGLIVGAFFVLICTEFGFFAGLGFSAVMILSPWVVLFAHNLYWAEWTWFIPSLIGFCFARHMLQNDKFPWFVVAIFVMGFLIKFLCGYEFITTIGISSCAPLLYGFYRYESSVQRLAKSVSVVSGSFGVALALAFFLHIQSLGDQGPHALRKIVSKRVAVSSAEEQAKAFCLDCPEPEECEAEFLETYGESLNANPLKVTAQYFVFADFLPWVGMSNYPMSKADRSDLKSAVKSGSLAKVRSFFSEQDSGAVLAVIVLVAINTSVFIVFCLMILRKMFRHHKQSPRETLYLAVLFLGPVSWFFLAKAHSQIHIHINFVLWFLLFVPFGVVYLLKSERPGALTSQT